MAGKNVTLEVLPANATPAVDFQKLEADLRRLDVGELRFDSHNRQLYATDASLYQVTPLGAVIPRDVSVVPSIVTYCASTHTALLPRGGGTSLAGQCTGRAVVLDLSPNCRRILEINPTARTCTVEPGISIDELNRALDASKTQLFFAPDPATIAQASIGGCIGNNAAGARSIRYGRTSENLEAVEVVLSTGERIWIEAGAGRKSQVALRLAEQVAEVVRQHADEIRVRFPNLIRRNAGYGLDLILKQLDGGIEPADLDLSGLICGSEGTLAVVVGARLKLNPVPRQRGLAVLSFDSVDAAIDAVVPILATKPSAVELLDDVVLRAAMGNAECRPYVDMLPTVDGKSPLGVLYVEYQIEDDHHTLDDFFASLNAVLPHASIATFVDLPAMNRAWTLRRASEALLHGLPGAAKPVTFVEDNSVPVERLRGFVAEFKDIVTRHGTEAAYYAHASVGVLHVRPMVDLHSAAGRETMVKIAVEVADLAKRCGGVMSGEHGDGRARGPLLAEFYGPTIIKAFKQIKTIFDPANILNPGNIVDAGPVRSIAENLRVDSADPQIVPNEIDTYFTYPTEEGFAGAVEMCNGAGFCRKTAGGTMCPSYRATLDERHSTRGRANAMRNAITGQSIDAKSTHTPQWTDAAVKETLDLCLSCKACKTECPSNVDIAQLKAEYSAQGHRQRGGPPLAARVFGHVRSLNKLGSIAPGLANWFNSLGPVRAMIGKTLGLSPKRSLPPFAPSLYRWFKKRRPRPTTGARVVVWADCFATYNEPNIGKAAIEVLEQLGYSVLLPKVGCCGRPMISNGLLDDAIQSADQTLDALKDVIADDSIEAVIFLEPSCLSAITDEWLKLNLRTDPVIRRRLAKKAILLEQFVESRWDKHPVQPAIRAEWKSAARPMVLHGHCHQKALGGLATTVSAINRLGGGKLDVLDSGCCGMAGAFGYTADRYELSMKIGELSVFPPVRTAEKDAIIIAAGTSCRHQIKDGTGRQSLHPAEVLKLALVCTDRP